MRLVVLCLVLAGCVSGPGQEPPEEVRLGAEVVCREACDAACDAEAIVVARGGDQTFLVCRVGQDVDGNDLYWLRLDVRVDACCLGSPFDVQHWRVDGATFIDFDPDPAHTSAACHPVAQLPFCPEGELTRQRGKVSGLEAVFSSSAEGSPARTAYGVLVAADGPWTVHFDSMQEADGRRVRSLGTFTL